MNMLTTITPKSDQVNSDDLIGKTMTIKVTKVLIGGGEQPVLIHFEGDGGKPYKPCKSMRRVLVQVWGPDGSEYVGKSLTLFRDPTVLWGGAPVGGIRISHMSHIDKPQVMALTMSKGSRKPYTVKPLVLDEPKKKDEIDPRLLAEGEASASQGVEAYKAWTKTLTPEQVKAIRPKHAEWVSIAKNAVVVEEAAEEEPDREVGEEG